MTTEEAKAKLERAFRVKYDREPLTDQDESLITSAINRVANGESFAWEGSTDSPAIRFSKPHEYDEETRWVLAKEAVCKLGKNQREAAEAYGLSYEALRKKCQREEWPIPARVAEAVPIVSQNRILAMQEAETWLERGEKSRAMAWKLTEKHLSKLANDPEKAPKVASWQDVATIVKLNRQAAGLDTAESVVANSFNFTLLGERMEIEANAQEVRPEDGQLPE